MKRQRTKTYETEVNGRKRHVSVPDDPDPEDMLIDGIQANLSPQTVAAIASFLQTGRTKNDDVNRQIQWFADMLTEMVGGGEEHNRLCEEIGL